MLLDPYYSLRRKFGIIGLTGRSASGCSQVAQLLSEDNLYENIKMAYEETHDQEELKQKICNRFIKENTWSRYTILKYRDVLLIMLFHEAFYQQNTIDHGVAKLFSLFGHLNTYYENGKLMKKKTTRLNSTDNAGVFEKLENLIRANPEVFEFLKGFDLNNKKEVINSKEFNEIYFGIFQQFVSEFMEVLNRADYFRRCLLLHDLATSFRNGGKIELDPESKPQIFIVVEHLNWILKNHKNFVKKTANLYVIDSLKNSLELTYFKEKYSAFYMVSAQ